MIELTDSDDHLILDEMMTPGRFPLLGREIHIWTLRMSAVAGMGALEDVLSSDEKYRAAQFHCGKSRQSFIIRRGILRRLLGRYIGLHPADVRFSYSAKGKPALATPPCVEFNTTHSSGLAAFAFTLGCPVGIDLELMSTTSEMADVGEHFFCEEEKAEIYSLPVSQRRLAFYLCWTRKEAYLKATGEGLSVPLDTCYVSALPERSVQLLQLRGENSKSRTWALHSFRMADTHVAALAYSDRPRPTFLFDLSDGNIIDELIRGDSFANSLQG